MPTDPSQYSKIKIVPLFGFMSGVLGQCYFVSLSPEKIEAGATIGQTADINPEVRLRRFLEVASTQYPELFAQRDQQAYVGRDQPLSIEEEKGDESSLKESEVEPQVESLGILRREGDGFIVDPLHGLPFGVEESSLNAVQSNERHQEPWCGALAPSWDSRAKVAVLATKEKFDDILEHLKELQGCQTVRALETIPETASSAKFGKEADPAAMEYSYTPDGPTQMPSLETAQSDTFMHGAYSWVAI
jgi:hypothetical protein